VPAATLTGRAPIRLLRSKRLLTLAGDERLVEQIRRGNELAFEVAYERHSAGILAFCRHMLGSREEAEDAVQHTFAAAFRNLERSAERSIALRAWLYTIARNRCISVLRARREQAAELHDLPTEGLSEQVEQRAELRELLADVRELPEEQRAALLLAEAAGLSHAEVAEVLGCETGSVKGLVFRARSSLIERRVARETPCEEIREQLATLRGGALRRNELRHHLRRCPGCSAYRDEVRRQRKLLAAALPVVPSLGLKSSVMGAAGVTGAAAGGTAAAGGGLALGSAAVAKVALVGVLAGTSVVAGEVAVDRAAQSDGPVQSAPAGERAPHSVPPPATAPRPDAVRRSGTHGEQISTERNHGQQGSARRDERSRGHGNAGANARGGDAGERTSSPGGRELGHAKQQERGGAGEQRQNGTAPGQAKSGNSGSGHPGSGHAGSGRENAAKPVKPLTSPTPRTHSPAAVAPQANHDTSGPAPKATAPAPPPTAPEQLNEDN
jgi:RNA polymerase sigma factor (sigma-70 family)